MPASEFFEWEALEKIEPFGEAAAWLRSATLTCIIANVHRRENTTAFTVDDFLPTVEAPKAQTPNQMFAFLMMIKDRQNAIAERQQKQNANA